MFACLLSAVVITQPAPERQGRTWRVVDTVVSEPDIDCTRACSPWDGNPEPERDSLGEAIAEDTLCIQRALEIGAFDFDAETDPDIWRDERV